MELFNAEKMFTYVRGFATGANMVNTIQALAFARQAHKGQKRKSGEPYIVHPLTLACHALALGIRDDVIIASCLLHDVVEDCDVSIDDLPVDECVRDTVALLTRTKGTPLDFYYQDIGSDSAASIVKLLDRCNNVSTMAGVFTPQKICEYIQETKDYVLPLVRKSKESWPQYSDVLFVMKYHICALITGLEMCFDGVSAANN